MNFLPTHLDGLFMIRPKWQNNSRGSFARMWGRDEFARAGHSFVPVQISTASNTLAGTLRGLHWQAPPHQETKLVRVVRGRIWDVVVDLRPNSATTMQWHGFELDAPAAHALLVPPGFAHGYITLTDDTEVLYAMDVVYEPRSARGARWSDPAFRIRWPREPLLISDRDATWPDFTELERT